MSEFYVGYLPKMPPGIRRRVRIAVAAMILLAIAGAALFAASQKKFAESYFEFGKPAEFAGTIALQPFPTLSPTGPAMPGESQGVPYLLVAPGKHGADALLAGWDGKQVRLRGTLIHRFEGRMIELEPASIAEAGKSPRNRGAWKDLGEATLSGEIVDTKCFLGVMNPGEGKVHRDCAARCLSGRIPPALVTTDIDGTHRILLLVGEDGKPLPKAAYLALVGQPVSIQAHAGQLDGLDYLRVETNGITALP
jgi:hypothetical protein